MLIMRRISGSFFLRRIAYKFNNYIYFFLFFSTALIHSACRPNQQKNNNRMNRDLVQIKDSGTLVALTIYGSTTYFIYRGQEMGYQYELCKQFTQSLGLDFKMKVARNILELTAMLQSGEGDLIAYNLPVTRKRKDSLVYCGMNTINHLVLVQRKKDRAPLIKDVSELIGKDIYVKPGRAYERINHLNSELGGGIFVHKVTNDSISAEDLIAQVAQNKISYTVVDNDLAKLNQTYYSNIDIQLTVGFEQRSSWAVRKNSLQLANAANEWFKTNKTSQAYHASIKRYFELSKTMQCSSMLSLQEGKISPYDKLFKKYATQIQWDWRLLASLAYAESNFDTAAVSWAGAKGLMQLMPATARAMGIPPGKEQNPEESIKAASKYIAVTEKSFQMVPNKDERTKFVLAAYNAGIGHIYDAMGLAEKYGKNKQVWDNNVERFILLKSNEIYYNDPVCKNGYFRGEETYSFVRNVMQRFEYYKKSLPE